MIRKGEAWRKLMVKSGVKNETIQDVIAAILLMSLSIYISTLF